MGSTNTAHRTYYIEGILPKGPYLPCVSMATHAGRALLAGYPRYVPDPGQCPTSRFIQCLLQWPMNTFIWQGHGNKRSRKNMNRWCVLSTNRQTFGKMFARHIKESRTTILQFGKKKCFHHLLCFTVYFHVCTIMPRFNSISNLDPHWWFGAKEPQPHCL